MTQQQYYDIIIVGGGIAGFSAAKAILEEAPGTRLLMVSAEDRIPYKRTNISKHIVQGFETNQFQLQPLDWYHENRLDLRIQCAVTTIDPDSKTLTLDNGECYSWKKLILATGADPVLSIIPGIHADRMCVVRTAQHVEGLLRDMHNMQSAAVVGMGVLGIEVAEQLRRLGKNVTLIGNHSTLMPHQLNQRAADIMQTLFESRGVELLFDEPGMTVNPHADNICEIVLQRGKRYVDRIVWCIGVKPNTELAKQAGLEVKCGIVVNQHLQTSHPDIYAAGDVAEHPGDCVTQLWHAAEHQGILAGLNAIGRTVPHEQPNFRLKCEVFDHYFFSINKPSPDEMSGCTLVENQRNDIYQGLYYADGVVQGIVMINDKVRAKEYEKAVREGWSRQAVEECLYTM